MEWSHANILHFIELYRNKPILWDSRDPQHYSKCKKQEAWRELAEELETTDDECRRKMTSLLASLRREKAKIRKSKRAGKGPGREYTSSWFAFPALEFVLDRNKQKFNLDTGFTNSWVNRGMPETLRDIEEELNGDNVTPLGASQYTVEKVTVSAWISERSKKNQSFEKLIFSTAEASSDNEERSVKEIGATANKRRQTCETITIETPSNDTKPRLSRNKKAKTNIQGPEKTMASAYNILKRATHKTKTTTRSTIDECESFGLFVTNKLRNYSRETRNVVQHRISNVLFEADQGRYDVVCPKTDATYEYDYEPPEKFSPHSSASIHPSPSPQASLESLQESEESNDACPT